jgi:hypothetical protein
VSGERSPNLKKTSDLFHQRTILTVEAFLMNKNLLNILRIDVLCPTCQQVNIQIVADLMASLQFNCHFCKLPIDVSSNQKVKAALDEIKDFVDHSYVPK